MEALDIIARIEAAAAKSGKSSAELIAFYKENSPDYGNLLEALFSAAQAEKNNPDRDFQKAAW